MEKYATMEKKKAKGRKTQREKWEVAQMCTVNVRKKEKDGDISFKST